MNAQEEIRGQSVENSGTIVYLIKASYIKSITESLLIEISHQLTPKSEILPSKYCHEALY